MRKNMEKKNKNLCIAFVRLGLFVGFVVCSHYLWGVRFSSFLYLSLLYPLVGMLFSVRTSTSLVGAFFSAKWLFGKMAFTFGIPTACGSANWSLYTHSDSTSKTAIMKLMLNVVLPISCMFLFIMHPVGQKAFFYSLFWLIPIAAYIVQFLGVRSFFLVALSSSFIAHAVGSVLWLYMMPMTPAQWLALIPVVAMERFVFTVGSLSVYCAARHFMGASQHVSLRKQGRRARGALLSFFRAAFPLGPSQKF